MRVLLITLIAGTLFLGAMFPAFVVLSGFLALMFMFAGMFLSLSGAFDREHVTTSENGRHTADNPVIMLSGIFGRKHVIVYKNGKRVDPFGNQSNDKHTADNPEVIVTRNHTEESDVKKNEKPRRG